MILKLEKILNLNRAHPIKGWITTLGLLLVSLWGFHQALQAYSTNRSAFNTYFDLAKTTAPLTRAHEHLNQSTLNPSVYLEEHLEKLPLLKQLENRFTQNTHASLPIQINPSENRLVHQSTVSSKRGKIHPMEFSLHKPVLIDEEDLKAIIALVEHRTIFPFQKVDQAPFFFFKSFILEKQRLDSCEHVYELSYTLESLKL